MYFKDILIACIVEIHQTWLKEMPEKKCHSSWESSSSHVMSDIKAVLIAIQSINLFFFFASVFVVGIFPFCAYSFHVVIHLKGF